MPLPTPKLDPRGYREILDETLRRIQVHNPEWTNFTESDPGVTLLQLFSFMSESLLYRANLIPERNRQKFLRLLGIPLRPASAAEGVVAFVNERGVPETVTLPDGVPVQAGRVGFVTRNALDVLPVEAAVYYRRQLTSSERVRARELYEQLYNVIEDDSTELEYYETTLFDPAAGRPVSIGEDTVDGALWIALLLRKDEQRDYIIDKIAGRTLTLGLMPANQDDDRVLPPGGPGPAQEGPPLIYELSSDRFNADQPFYTRLDARPDGNAAEDLTLVQLTLPSASEIGAWLDLDPLEDGVGDFPPALEEDEIRDRLIAWIRVRLAEPPTAGTAPAWKVRLDWVGLNAARITQRVEVQPERLGTGTGEPDQSYTLINTPVIPDSVVLTVAGERWQLTDDLSAAPPEIAVRGAQAAARAGDPRVFTIDRESGEVRFGDGLRGTRPPLGAVIIASYAYGGGSQGNVGTGVAKTSALLPPGFRVSNPVPTWGGSEGETIAEAEKSIPRYLKHRDRAVSTADFREIVQQTPGIALGRVEIRPLFHPAGNTLAPGVVTVLVIPDDPAHPEAPVPDQFFLKAVCAYLEPRRLLTTEIHVHGPEYVPISVAVGIDVVPGKDIAIVREAVKQAIRDFVSPLIGGQAGTGWPLEKAIEDRELWARAARVDGVSKVRGLRLWDGSGVEAERIGITGLQLPKLDRVTARFGDAEDLLAQTVAPTTSTGKRKRRVPVPVLPPSC